jgi:dihydroneopterin aldolase
MDKIIMENMAFYGHHGLLDEEKRLGQKFFVDAYIYLPLKQAGETDDLNFSVNYAAVYEIIKNIVTNERFNLLEGLAERLCAGIFAACPLAEKLRIRIRKPEAPVPGIFDCFGVEIERFRRK